MGDRRLYEGTPRSLKPGAAERRRQGAHRTPQGLPVCGGEEPGGPEETQAGQARLGRLLVGLGLARSHRRLLHFGRPSQTLHSTSTWPGCEATTFLVASSTGTASSHDLGETGFSARTRLKLLESQQRGRTVDSRRWSSLQPGARGAAMVAATRAGSRPNGDQAKLATRLRNLVAISPVQPGARLSVRDEPPRSGSRYLAWSRSGRHAAEASGPLPADQPA